MRSSSGQHYVALDHVRALAAFLVFAWHFAHDAGGSPVPFEGAPVLPFAALFDEGHTGVALFMTLSGYLFAKLLEGRRIDYWAFLANRALRLFPLLGVVVLLVGVERALRGEDLDAYALTLFEGVVMPRLPNGGWSVTVEFHFYLVLPLLLWFLRRSSAWIVLFLAGAIGVRCAVWALDWPLQNVAYKTIFGRFDDFALGVLACHYRSKLLGRNALALATAASFGLFYYAFDWLGGYYGSQQGMPLEPLWIVLPTLEGLAYGVLIAWYDGARPVTVTQRESVLSRFVARIGEVSYSLYLLHFFFVFRASHFVHEQIMPIDDFFLALAWSVPAFVLMLVPASLSYELIERPFLLRRKPYAVPDQT